MRTKGIDSEEAESLLEMQMYSMLFHASAAIVVLAIPSLIQGVPGGSGAARFSLLVGVFLCSVYLGCGVSYVIDLLRVKFKPYSYIGKSLFKTMPLWFFWMLSIAFSSAVMAIILL
ncbi:MULTISPECIES: hypothetical protein [unclassified Nocardiopsis]|uniref:hypothetical protein n=1 Tax=Nocardiopsis TaxID=2013 RepID=UPI00387A918D